MLLGLHSLKTTCVNMAVNVEWCCRSRFGKPAKWWVLLVIGGPLLWAGLGIMAREFWDEICTSLKVVEIEKYCPVEHHQ